MSDKFEENLVKAEEILTILNNDETNLEDSLKLFKEGKKLLSDAQKMLEEAKLNVEHIEND